MWPPNHAADGIRINAVFPETLHTDGLERAGAQARADVARTLPLRRLGQPAEVARAILWSHWQPVARPLIGHR
ncbi:SDR family oxidoreductase [Nocardia wallacei]|uniref:SDR family oxidoreductase n=1 Tax=Nocardia wallacei TaxID=480035 RepID=UPI003CC7DDB1